jgi:hypothetical protein
VAFIIIADDDGMAVDIIRAALEQGGLSVVKTL